ncbi:helix-turn-helix domain-containing protein [Actinokineospora sp. 24-640]
MVTTGAARVEPGVARRLLRYELQRMCADSGVTHAQMGARLGVSRASFTQMLMGKSLPSRAALEVLANHLGASNRLPMLLEVLGLARSRSDTDSTGGDRDLLVGLEAYAHTIEVYDPLVISPPLRASAYARVLSDAGPPRGGMFWGDNPATLVWIVEEHALRRVVGDAAVMRSQYVHLCALAELPHVTIQVMPADSGAHPGLAGGFEIVHGSGGTVVCELTRQAAHYADRPEVVAEYAEMFGGLRKLALSPEESEVMLRHLR